MRSLFVGNIGNAEKKIIKYFDNHFGKKSNDIYKKNKLDYKKLFYSKEYDNVFYFANGFDECVDDLNNFLRILDGSNGVKKYIFIVKSNKFDIDSDNENVEVIKEIFDGYRKKKGKNIVFLNASCLYGNDFIEGEINNTNDGKNNNIVGNYVHIDDFSRFLYLLAYHRVNIDYIEFRSDISVNIKELLSSKKDLNLVSEVSLSNFLFDYKFEHSIVSDVKNGFNVWKVLKSNIKDRERHPVIKVLEIVIMFLITEFSIGLFNTTFNIQYIDFRLVFLVVIAIYYGMKYSLFAVGLAIMAFLFTNVDSTYGFSVILTNTNNWVVVAVYLIMVIVISSKIRRYNNQIKSMDEKINALELSNRHKQRNLNKYEVKIKDLNRMVITQDNSLAKVANFVIGCRNVNDKSIFELFADNLETDSIVVFKVNRNRFSTAYTTSSVDYSFLVQEKVSTFIKNNNVWANTDLIKDFPLYMVPICDAKGLCYVVTIWDYDVNIMNNDYRNNLLSLASIVSFLKESEK